MVSFAASATTNVRSVCNLGEDWHWQSANVPEAERPFRKHLCYVQRGLGVAKFDARRTKQREDAEVGTLTSLCYEGVFWCLAERGWAWVQNTGIRSLEVTDAYKHIAGGPYLLRTLQPTVRYAIANRQLNE